MSSQCVPCRAEAACQAGIAHREKSSLFGVTSRSPFLPPPCCFCCCFCFCCFGCCCCCSVATSPATVDSATRPRRTSCRLLTRCAALHSLQNRAGNRQHNATAGKAASQARCRRRCRQCPSPTPTRGPRPNCSPQAARHNSSRELHGGCWALERLHSVCRKPDATAAPRWSSEAQVINSRGSAERMRCARCGSCGGRGRHLGGSLHGPLWRLDRHMLRTQPACSSYTCNCTPIEPLP